MNGIEAMLLIALKPESNNLRQLYLRGNLASSRIGSELQTRSCARTHSHPDILPSAHPTLEIARRSVRWTDRACGVLMQRQVDEHSNLKLFFLKQDSVLQDAINIARS
jgi:hypothetical protein